jgi:hypothetical protein
MSITNLACTVSHFDCLGFRHFDDAMSAVSKATAFVGMIGIGTAAFADQHRINGCFDMVLDWSSMAASDAYQQCQDNKCFFHLFDCDHVSFFSDTYTVGFNKREH